MSYVFISYVRDDAEQVEHLARDLSVYGIDVWLDREQIKPGERWQDAIRHAIHEGKHFIACFSSRYATREKSYMNEELALAIEQLRQYSESRIWFIPVLLSKCEVPDRNIGPGETLRSLQWVELYHNWDEGIKRIANVIAPGARKKRTFRRIPDLKEEERDLSAYMPDLKEEEWDFLLRRIDSGKCIPFLGAGVNIGLILTESDTAQQLANKHGYPQKDVSNLAEVAQLLAVSHDPMYPKEEILSLLKKVPPPDFNALDEVHGVLADLPLPLYITTNYDDLIEQALRSRKKAPITELCHWNRYLENKPSIFGKELHFKPTPSNPVVFHLYGHSEAPESLVLTEDDHLEFFANLSGEPDLLPAPVLRALVMTQCLFIGYSARERRFQMLYKNLGKLMERGPGRFRHITPFLLTFVAYSKSQKEQEYLEKYFDKTGVDFHRGITIREFMAGLRQRWRGFRGGD